MAIRYSKQASQLLDRQADEIYEKLSNHIEQLAAGDSDSLRITSYDMPPLVGAKSVDDEHWILFLTETRNNEMDLIVCNVGPLTAIPHLWDKI